jgi:hypothetical protein
MSDFSGYDHAVVSAACKIVATTLIEKLGHLVSTDNATRMEPARATQSTDAMRKRYLKSVTDNNAEDILFNEFGLNIACTLDGTRYNIRQPTQNARPYFSGWKKDYCLLYCAAFLPSGLAWYLTDPEPGSSNDVTVYNLYDLNRIARDTHDIVYLCDSIFPRRTNTFPIHNLLEAAEAQASANDIACLRFVRATAEWGFAALRNTFPYVGLESKHKIHVCSPDIYIRSAVLLSNFIICVRGSQSGLVFEMAAPSLSDYIGGKL